MPYASKASWTWGVRKREDEGVEGLTEECRKHLRWYERRWQEDWARWQAEKAALEERLQALEDILYEERHRLAAALNEQRAQYETQLSRKDEDLRRLRQQLDACTEALSRLQTTLERTSRAPLGEGFFQRLARDIALWDQTLLQEAQRLSGQELRPFLQGLWSRRSRFLAGVLEGQDVDWKELWTGLVLEWALWAWLEGQGTEPLENGHA